MSIPRKRRSGRGVATVSALGIAIAPLALSSVAHAAVDGSKVVISEVYGGGGNSSATYSNDYVELYNPTSSSVSLAGMSVQYRSAGGTANPSGVIPLTGSIASHGHYLVGAASGGSTGAAIPTPDVSNTGVNLSATAGTVFLANQTAALTSPPTGSVLDNPAIVDLVGFGTSNTFERSVAPAGSNTAAVARTVESTDTDNNGADFTAKAPAPENTSTSGGGGTQPPTGTPATIEEIQGTGDASPLVGEDVTTRGIVTASYPTGGYRGFYIQTPGTGGSVDLGSHAASDGLFVYLGGAAASAYPAPGSYVEVTGPVSEYYGLTQVSPASTAVSTLNDVVPAVKPAEVAFPSTDAARETLEGMLIAPQGPYTVADNYSLNQYAEIGLARGTTPLRQPTDVARPQTQAAAGVAADNAARAVTLDDGATTNFFSGANKSVPLPYLTPATPIRVGAPVTFSRPVVLDYRNSAWKLEPTSQLTAANAASVQPATFENTRSAHPDDVGGDLQIASFNVLNYFTETGENWEADGGTCSYYTDRAGNRITVNSCNGVGPRGAANTENRLRQQAKIVKAINALGADVLSLEEIENSAKYAGPDRRDDALATLVDALNADAGSQVWDYVRSPKPEDRPAITDEDVIRTAFIYHRAEVEPVGESRILLGSTAFSNARKPLAQVFRPAGGTPGQQFLVIVNHFKSKGSGVDDGTGQGNSNPDRVAQAHALVDFADQVKQDTGTQQVFLTGDFNAYTQEDPMQVLYDAGYTDIGSARTTESTYLFDGVVGSLDHVLANDAGYERVTGADVWNINSVESVALEYSRYNYNATNFYEETPFRSSDHDPLVVGYDALDPSYTSARLANGRVLVDRSHPVVLATVSTADGPLPTGTVEVWDGGTRLATGEVVDGEATVHLPRFTTTGSRTLTVRFPGQGDLAPSEATVEVSVVKPPVGG